MFQGGADVVYHAAGGSGGGVFTAAKEANKMAIGVDSDQAKTASPDVQDVIITSMIKRVDVAVYEFLTREVEDSFEAGEQVFDLAAGGVDYSTTGGKVDDIKDQLDELKQRIVDGEITVPTSPES
jgi:basic membrane protein A and related proteins